MGRFTVALLSIYLLAGATGLACGRGGPPGQGAPISPLEPPAAAATPASLAAPTALPTLTTTPAPPTRDLLDLAQRFRNFAAERPSLVGSPPRPWEVNDSREFTLLDLEVPATYRVPATLRLVTDHAYFFVQDGVTVFDADLAAVAAEFEERVYPRVTAAFGPLPASVGDSRIIVLHAELEGASGYVTSADRFPLAVAPNSNEAQTLYLDWILIYADAMFRSPYRATYNSVIAHELQHLLHGHADPDEEAWVNEGLSQVAAEMVAIAPCAGTGSLTVFLARPDTQLNHWPAEGDTAVHYAASQLFFRYLLDRYGGRENAAVLMRIPEDGIAGVEAYLAPLGTTFLAVFADWLVASYLDEEDGPYAHADVEARVTDITRIAGPAQGEGTVHQFGADYLEVQVGPNGAVFTFDGADQVSMGIPPQSGSPSAGPGQAFWWSGRGDAIDSRLTREFDLTALERATLRFRTWFHIEHGWDYAYVAVSIDEGRTWQALPGRHTTDYDPMGQAYGPGYTGASGGGEPVWVTEEIDLSPIAGRRVLLRFEYVTDDAANLTGFAVDDIEVPEIGFQDTADDGSGWTAEGFHRVEAPLPQRFLLQVIERGPPGRVTRILLDGLNRAEIALTGPATIVVAAVTEGTTEMASYQWSLSPR